MDQDTITIERTYDAPLERVWRAITEHAQMKRWYMADLMEFRPEPGFQTQFDVHHEGKDYLHIWKVTEVIPHKKISYEWKYGGYPGNSLVTFELSAEGKRTRVTLTHSGLETFFPDQHPELSKENFLAGWTQLIGTSLKEFTERSAKR